MLERTGMRRIRFTRPELWTSPVWRRLDALLSGGVRQRITMLGYTFAAIIVVVGLAAFLSANNLLFLILALLLAVFLVSGFVSRLGLAGLELELTLPEHLTARQSARARVQVRNIKQWMPSFSIRLLGADANAFPVDLYFPVVPGKTALGETVPVLFARRGSYRENSFQFLTRFPFGFTERRIQVPLRGEVIVYPSIAPQPAFEDLLERLEGEIASRRKGHGTDFHRVRPYEYGENVRHVDWKSTAHTGNLQVREFTSHDNRQAEIFLDLAPGVGEEFLAWFERAVECAAFLVWHLTRQEIEVRFRTQERSMVTPGEVDAYAVLKYLATVEPLTVAPLAGAALAARPDEDAHVHVALTAAPERWGEWNCPALPGE
jgi:uncharacterized protein (DUF58 family)